MNAMVQQPEYSPISLVNKPKLATPDDGGVALPPVPGAGTATPLPGASPQPIEGVTALPFGNGVSPVMMPTGQGFGGAPVLKPTNDPMVGAPPIPGAPDGNVQGTLIAPKPGADPIADINYWRQQFGGMTGGGDDINPGELDPRAGSWQGRVDAAAGGLENMDRRSMLNSLLSDFDKQSAERDDNAYTQVGRRGAALGRIGSGMVSQDLNQIARQSMGDKQIFRNQLAADTIDKEIGDRFGKLSAFQSVGNDAFNQASSDRGFKYGVNADNRNFKRSGVLDAANLAGQFFDRSDAANRANRNEYRSERDYQDSREQTGIDRRLQQTQVEEALKSGDFNRALQLLQQGKTGSPAAGYAGAAGDLSNQSSQTAQLLMQFLNSMGYGGQRAAAY